MIRLVAFDLDGTVLDEAGRASDASMDAIRGLVATGVGVASISGRSVANSQAPFDDVPELSAAMYIGSYNGALVLGPGKDGDRRLLLEERLPEAVFIQALEYVDAEGHNFVYCRCELSGGRVDEAYMTDRESASVEGLRALGVRFVVDANLASRVRNSGSGPPPKLIVMPGRHRREAVLEEMRDLLGEQVYLARTGDDRLEIMSRRVNKGAALRAICEACGVSVAESLAFGDGDNDLPMLKTAGTGMLMENADDHTKCEAEGAGIRLEPSVQSDGFAGALKALGFGVDPR